MTAVDYGITPPVARDTRSVSEYLRDCHREAVGYGPKGPFVVLAVFFSSSAAQLALLARWCYRRCAGYT